MVFIFFILFILYAIASFCLGAAHVFSLLSHVVNIITRKDKPLDREYTFRILRYGFMLIVYFTPLINMQLSSTSLLNLEVVQNLLPLYLFILPIPLALYHAKTIKQYGTSGNVGSIYQH